MQMRLAHNTGTIAYAIAALWTINLIAHFQIYVSAQVIPLAHSHSIPVEALGAIIFFAWFVFAVGVYGRLAPRASRLGRWGLRIGIAAPLYVSVLHILFVFEILWFSDSLAAFVLGMGGMALWVITVLDVSRVMPGGTSRPSAVTAPLIFLSVLVYPLLPIMLWKRISGNTIAPATNAI